MISECSCLFANLTLNLTLNLNLNLVALTSAFELNPFSILFQSNFDFFSFVYLLIKGAPLVIVHPSCHARHAKDVQELDLLHGVTAQPSGLAAPSLTLL